MLRKYNKTDFLKMQNIYFEEICFIVFSRRLYFDIERALKKLCEPFFPKKIFFFLS